ncbi:peroxisomal dehydratase [Tricladium varicosporioides]|nr:peroxisomal dehydratase [Hymenoscyphus varicosporioides]
MTSFTKVSWLRRDALLFANSIGCKADGLHFLYENHPDFEVFPTYPVVLSFKDDTQDVIPYNTTLPHPPIPSKPHLVNLPKLDPACVVDGSRHLKIHKPLPATSQGRNFWMRKRIIGVYDKGSGTLVHSLHELVDEDSEDVYASTDVQSFYVGQGSWGGPRGPLLLTEAQPSRTPDFVVKMPTTAETPLLYRLNGDYNPLHADPTPGQALGFGGVVLHGLISWNACAYAIIQCVGKNDGRALKEFGARFVAPVKGGDILVVEIWKDDIVSTTRERVVEVRFICKVEGGVVVLTNGRALLRGRGIPHGEAIGRNMDSIAEFLLLHQETGGRTLNPWIHKM